MGSAHIWYYPSTVPHDIDLLRPFTTRRGPSYRMDQAIMRSAVQQVATTHLSGLLTIDLALKFDVSLSDNMESYRALRRHLFGLTNHLQRGGWIALSENVTYAWAAWATVTPHYGDTALNVMTTNIMPNASAVNLLDREVYVQADPELAIGELKSVSTDAHTTTGRLLLDETVKFDYDGAQFVLVREAGSYPALRLVPEQRNDDILVTDNDYVFELKLRLEEDPTVLYSIGAQNTAIPTGAFPGPQIDITPPQYSGNTVFHGLPGTKGKI